jgi:hypothetical protein
MASWGLPITKRTPSNSTPSPPSNQNLIRNSPTPTDPIMKAGGVYTTGKRFGMSDTLRTICERMVNLWMSGRADSINLGVAAGVMIYEVARRVKTVLACSS